MLVWIITMNHPMSDCLIGTYVAFYDMWWFGQVDRENIFWRAHAKKASIPCLQNQATDSEMFQMHVLKSQKNPINCAMGSQHIETSMGHNHPLFVLHLGKRLPFTI